MRRPISFEEVQERAVGTRVVGGGVTEVFSESAEVKVTGIRSVLRGVSVRSDVGPGFCVVRVFFFFEDFLVGFTTAADWGGPPLRVALFWGIDLESSSDSTLVPRPS